MAASEKVITDAVAYSFLWFGKPETTFKPQHLDVYLWLLTGFGELGCYEVLPFVMDHKRAELWTGQSNYSVVLVTSLLVSLMIDQVSSLREWGVTAAILSNHPGVAVNFLVTILVLPLTS